MAEAENVKPAVADAINRAQAWEDADILVAALRPKPADTVVTSASACDSAFALLAEGPERVIAIDLNPAQLACVRLRAAMYRTHTHPEFLELMGSRPSGRRRHLLEQVASHLPSEDQAFWANLKEQVARHGVGGVGQTERFFRAFREWALPFIHTTSTIDNLLAPRDPDERQRFYDKSWNIWGWRMMLKVFLSPFVMRRLGRDATMFDHVEGGAAAQASRLTRKALVDQDPSANPYLHWILKGEHGEALPRALDAERHEVIRQHLDRLEIRLCSMETLADEGVKADVFNLSDNFERMSPGAHAKAYEAILAAARPGARIAYWNVAAARRVPVGLASRVKTNADLQAKLKPLDKAPFYSDFVIEEIL